MMQAIPRNGINAPSLAKGGMVNGSARWASARGQILSECPSTPSERTFYYQRNRYNGTNSGSVVRVSPSPPIKRDTYVDNEIGETLRLIKAKSGNAPFAEAYKKARSTSKAINDRRKKCLEEEVRLRSVLRAGEE